MNLQEVRNQLPHGAIKEIAKRVGLTSSTITLYFKGKCKTSKAPDIIKAASDILKEYKNKEREAKQALDSVLNCDIESIC